MLLQDLGFRSRSSFCLIIRQMPFLLVVLGCFMNSSRSTLAEQPTLENKTEKAAKEQPAGAEDRSKMANLKVVLVDSEGKPVAGASVMPYAMRVKETDGHGFWNDEKFGPPKIAISDERGHAVIQYPAILGVGSDVYTTILVTFMVTHFDFVQQVVHFNLGPPQADVTLTAGSEVQIWAVDDAGKPIRDFAIIMAGPFATDQWVSDGQNCRRTRAIKDGKWQTLLVSIPEHGPLLFSGVLPLNVRPKQAVKLRNVRLSPGARLKGTLSPDVPRPIKQGRIIATAVPKPAGANHAEDDPSVIWHDSTGIDEQGNFEFASLPRGGEVQIIALCDGWVSKNPPDNVKDFFTLGQLFSLDAPEQSVTVEMERTGTLEVTLTKPDGSPLEGANVATWPNQLYHKGGSTILGREFNSREQVETQLTPVNQRVRKPRNEIGGPYSVKTNAQGMATLKGIPIGRFQSLSILHPQFGLPVNTENERVYEYQIQSSEVKQIDLKTRDVTKPMPNNKL